MITRWKAATGAAGIAALALSACDGGKAGPAPSQNPIAQSLPERGTIGPRDGATAAPTSPGAEPAEQQRSELRLAVEGEGLRLFNATTGAALPIAFGRQQTDVLKALNNLRGTATKGTNEDCGAGPVDYATWPDGLSIVFQRGRFVGWGISSRATGVLTTASGVGPGSTREQLDAAYADVSVRQSSLGTEFSAGGFWGLIDGTKASSRITDMWAGTSCAAR